MSGKKSESSEKREKKRERESEEKARPAALGFSPAKKLEVKFVFACSSRGRSSSASSGSNYFFWIFYFNFSKLDITQSHGRSKLIFKKLEPLLRGCWENTHSQGNAYILPHIFYWWDTIKYSSVYNIPLRSIYNEVSHGRSKLIFKKLEPLLRGCWETTHSQGNAHILPYNFLLLRRQ